MLKGSWRLETAPTFAKSPYGDWDLTCEAGQLAVGP